MKTNLLVDKLIKQTEDKKLMNSMVYGFALFIVKSFAIYILWNFLATQNFFFRWHHLLFCFMPYFVSKAAF